MWDVIEPYIVPLALVVITAVAISLGNYVRTKLRMPDSGWKVTLIVAVLGIAGVILQTSWPPKQGIDLKGGVILIYKVDEALTERNARSQAAGEADSDVDSKVNMPALIGALGRRINPGGVEEIVVRRYGDSQVEVIIPEAKAQEVERVKKLITTGGFLKFMIVANQTDHDRIWRLADDPRQTGQYEVRDESGRVVAQWVKLTVDPSITGPDGGPVYREDPSSGKNRVVRGRKEVLMVVDARNNLQGSHLSSVRQGRNDAGLPAVFFDMTPTGSRLMFRLTSENEPNPTAGHFSLLGIVMDGELISAPRINETISGSGIIEGSFTDEEVKLLVDVLRAGRLPAVLYPEPISQNQISALLGQDTIDQGRRAILISLVAVLVFMIFYYHFAGVVACVALLTNLMLILALMIFVGASFSLPGMAGLVLTVGMSVDANVLIFERIREELRNGAALRMAIRNGFGRATRTIVDANVTTLITAVVLYGIGTEQLRAFAVTLIFGILMCLFTAIFCSRVVFDIAERRGWIKKLTMLQIMSAPDWNLIGKRHIAGVCSLVLIVVSIVAVSARGTKIFDIDFLGGTSVQMQLLEPMPIGDVRELAASMKEDGTVENISVTGVKKTDVPDGSIYRIDTSLPDGSEAAATQDDSTQQGGDGGETVAVVESPVKTVQVALMDRFAGKLKMHSMTFTDPVQIQGDPEADAAMPNMPLEGNGRAEVDESDLDGGAELTAPDDDSKPGPETDDGSSATSPDANLLAFAGDVLLAQAPEGTPAVDDDSGNEAAGDQPDDSSGSQASDDSPEPDATTVDESTDANTTLPETPDISFPDGANALDLIHDASTLRTRSDLEFDEGINMETLEELIRETATELDLTEPDILLENSDPEWDNASTRSYAEWTLTVSSDVEQTRQMLTALKSKLDSTPVWLAASQIGSSIAGDKTRMALAAVIASLLGIIGYIWIRFQRVVYGLAAVVALVHDVTITLGAIALSAWLANALGFLMIDEFKISLPVVAAFLTIIGYSLNDTIVVFDRVREVKGKSPEVTVEIVNTSINQTLTRTFLTSLTTLIAVAILYVIGGQGIHAFAYSLLIGVVVGTYSSIFIASPMLLWMSGSTKPEKVRQKVAA